MAKQNSVRPVPVTRQQARKLCEKRDHIIRRKKDAENVAVHNFNHPAYWAGRADGINDAFALLNVPYEWRISK